MNKNLKILINDYLTDVARGNRLFKELIGDKFPLKAWHDHDIPQNGDLADGVKYEMHGVGCLLVFPDYDVDFNFGPNGRIDGFDLWRLSQYLTERAAQYPSYRDINLLKTDFEEAIKNGDIKQNTHPYCNLYYLDS